VPDRTPTLSSAEPGFQIYPNPASDNLSIASNVNHNSYEAFIYNYSGVLIKKTTLGSQTPEIDISNLDSQSYIIVLKDSKSQNTLLVSKFIKE
jgi:hypothetical protein